MPKPHLKVTLRDGDSQACNLMMREAPTNRTLASNRIHVLWPQFYSWNVSKISIFEALLEPLDSFWNDLDLFGPSFEQFWILFNSLWTLFDLFILFEQFWTLFNSFWTDSYLFRGFWILWTLRLQNSISSKARESSKFMTKEFMGVKVQKLSLVKIKKISRA